MIKNSKVAYSLLILEAREPLLNALKKAQENNNGKNVSFEEIKSTSGYKSEARLRWHLGQLERHGFVQRKPKDSESYSMTRNASSALREYEKLKQALQSMSDSI